MTARFWVKVRKGDDCWHWIGAALPRGYGRFYWRGKPRYAHRVSLEIAGIEVPDNAIVLHSCDNPACVNPAHLRVGTQTDNMRDAAIKGRTVRVGDWRGTKNPKAKLSDVETAAIASSSLRTSALAAQFGVSRTRVQQIRRVAKRLGGGWDREVFE